MTIPERMKECTAQIDEATTELSDLATEYEKKRKIAQQKLILATAKLSTLVDVTAQKEGE